MPTEVSKLEITNVANGDVLSGDVAVVIAVDGDILYDDIVLNVNGTMVGASPKQGDPQNPFTTYVCFSTERFTNGSYTLQATDNNGHSSARTVTFQNGVSNLHYNALFDDDMSATDAPHFVHITANVTAGLTWTVRIKDAAENVVKTFPSGTGSIDVTWNGIHDAGVFAGTKGPDSNYLLDIVTAPTTASLERTTVDLDANFQTRQGDDKDSETASRWHVRKSGPSVLIEMGLPHYGNWDVELYDNAGELVWATATKKPASSLSTVWDGSDSEDHRVPDGNYTAVAKERRKAPKQLPNVQIARLEVGTVVSVKGIINQDSFKDSFLLISTDVIGAPSLSNKPSTPDPYLRRQGALRYATNIVNQLKRIVDRNGGLALYPNVLVLSPDDFADPANKEMLIKRIDKHFATKAALIYVCAHGGWVPSRGQKWHTLFLVSQRCASVARSTYARRWHRS